MATLPDLIKSIYYGDRAVLGMKFDAVQKSLSIQFNLLSRIRSDTGSWDFYTDEDISNATLVFHGIEAIDDGIANYMNIDEIYDIIVESSDHPFYRVTLVVAVVSENNHSSLSRISMIARTASIIDPAKSYQIES